MFFICFVSLAFSLSAQKNGLSGVKKRPMYGMPYSESEIKLIKSLTGKTD